MSHLFIFFSHDILAYVSPYTECDILNKIYLYLVFIRLFFFFSYPLFIAGKAKADIYVSQPLKCLLQLQQTTS